MPKINLTLNPVECITVDAIGKPGNRIFYIQGTKDEQIISLIIEKIHLQTLILEIKDFHKEINSRFNKLPSLTPTYKEKEMQIQPPVDPLFRVGDIGLAYDKTNDMVCVIVRENPADAPKNESGVVRYWCSRSQLTALGNWAVVVIERGRKICPQCMQPMEPEGHFCPKKNGHKKNIFS